MVVIDGNKLVREISALGLGCVSIFVILSLATFSAQDPSLSSASSDLYAVHNAGGVIGAMLAGMLVDLLGVGAWIVPGLALLATGRLLWPPRGVGWTRLPSWGILFLCGHVGLEVLSSHAGFRIGDMAGGGYLGQSLQELGMRYLHAGGSAILWVFLTLVGLQTALRISWSSLLGALIQAGGKAADALAGLLGRVAGAGRRTARIQPQGQGADKEDQAGLRSRKAVAKAKPKPRKQAKSRSTPQPVPAAQPPEPVKPIKRLSAEHDLPPADLLDQIPAQEEHTQDDLQGVADKLASCLDEFGVQGTVVETKPGPVVSMIEFRPAPGVKISRIANLNDDLALALKASAVRIEAPIPGKDLVGVEIPNQDRKTVYFRSIIESDAFQKSQKPLTMALGQDIQGQARAESLAHMPHLLVAGATGAGKSVCLNSILTSFLFTHSPQDLKLMLVDPKRIEMAPYGDLPHLIHPVVTEMDMAKTALDWAVHEMDRRYAAMARLSVRNIEAYNSKLAKMGDDLPEELQDLERMPFLVIIIDELADLMFTAGKEAEASIVRLAQLARAAGLHLIIATQRPSVDVVTGLIKANFPARIAFQVSSRHDSRTILDSGGAEYLLGKGDMLFKSSAGRMERIHGAFISDNEINAAIDFWKHKEPAPAQVDLAEWKQDQQGGGGNGADDDISQDPLYDQAVESVVTSGKASISMIQRQMRIGFNRAARFIEQMERDGIIGPQEGSKPRTVLRQ
ncbi:DNA translocase FtsK [Desulfovermiculus halophilus]|uniref:DNA translocase FtsK n=1 Tax=Desulfovermiculus halophilus TaxID=339722 RepID=UPI0006841F10|nr:DNA translocase FtsK [Desulfovermiculus halophilus]